MFPPVLLLLISLCLSSWGLAVPATAAVDDDDDLRSDVAALVALMEALAPWPLRLRHSGWTTNINYDNLSIHEPCSWHGVTCGGAQIAAPEGVIDGRRIVELHLPGAGLSGTIPAATLGRLTALRVLSLRSNRLSGQLPSDLANCVELRALYLNDNLFSHTLPSFTLSKIVNSTVTLVTVPPLLRLNLADNNFSSSIPSSYALLLPHLTGLFLQNNSLTGPLPDFLDSSSANNNLQLSLANNRLQGVVPPSLQQKFGLLAFQGNNFCGAPLFAECANAPTPMAAPTESQPDHDDVASPPITSEGPPPAAVKRTLSPGDIAAIVVAGVALALLVAACCVVWCVKRRRAYYLYNSGSEEEEEEEEDEESAKSKDSVKKPNRVGSSRSRRRRDLNLNLQEEEEEEEEESAAADKEKQQQEELVFMEESGHRFGLEDLLRSSAEVLGKGPVGTSYKATLEMGRVVVVKRLRDVAGALVGRTDFEQHVMKVLAGLRHPNLLPLQAFYFSKEEKLLVHDYMPHGSLSSHLHGPGRKGKDVAATTTTTLDWDTRMKIAIGCARGIAFLHQHEFGGNKLVHGNIKSSNVVLSSNNEAKLSDFALAPLYGSSSPIVSRAMGYKAPEVQDARMVTQKADVYSFGVLLLEILTGKLPTHTSNEGGMDLPRWVQSVVREQWTAEVFDLELMRHPNIEEEMVQTLRIAMECVAPLPDKRPSIIEVVKMLEDVRPIEIYESHNQHASSNTSKGSNGHT